LIVNYFNYFTEIEEHFQRARGTALFLMSPLDWALVESWKNAEVPLEAVMRGIDAAFEKWRSRKHKTQMVNSLAFCAQAVLTEAQIMSGAIPARREAPPPFPLDELRTYLLANADTVEERFPEIAASLRSIAAGDLGDLEGVEQRLAVLEEKMIAAARVAQSEDGLLAARRELDRHLRPYRGKMTADQLSMLERQFLERALLEKARLPRLSLFYFR
jgi:hypothetical protein